METDNRPPGWLGACPCCGHQTTKMAAIDCDGCKQAPPYWADVTPQAYHQVPISP